MKATLTVPIAGLTCPWCETKTATLYFVSVGDQQVKVCGKCRAEIRRVVRQ